MKPDPIGQAGGINLFVYANNNSINGIDLYGLYTWPYTWKGWAGVILTGSGAVAAFVPGGLPVGLGLMGAGGAFTLWDIVEGFNQAESFAKEAVKKIIIEKIRQVGDARLAQEMGLIPSTKQLKNLGFTDKELKKLGFLEDYSQCK